MNDRDLWPIHIIFFGFLIALVILAVKMMVEEIFNNPLFLFFILAVLLSVWFFRKRN
jgi:hypothetical protein